MVFTGSGQDGNFLLMEGSGTGASNAEVIPKQLEVELVEVPPQPEEGDIALENSPQQEVLEDAVTECKNDDWYGGIGIRQDYRTNKIEEVFEGYPAQLSGLKVEDIIEYQSDPDIRGEPGTKLKLQIYRPSEGRSFLVEVTRDKICTLGRK